MIHQNIWKIKQGVLGSQGDMMMTTKEKFIMLIVPTMKIAQTMDITGDTNHPVQCLYITVVTEVEQWTDTDMDPKLEDGRSSLRMRRTLMLKL